MAEGTRKVKHRMSHAEAHRLYKALERDREQLADTDQTLVQLAARYGNELGFDIIASQIREGFDVAGIEWKGRQKQASDADRLDAMQAEIDLLKGAMQSVLDRLDEVADRLTRPSNGHCADRPAALFQPDSQE